MKSIIVNYNPEIELNLFWLLDHFSDELVYVENTQRTKDEVLEKLTEAIKSIKAIKEDTDLDEDISDIINSLEEQNEKKSKD